MNILSTLKNCVEMPFTFFYLIAFVFVFSFCSKTKEIHKQEDEIVTNKYHKLMSSHPSGAANLYSKEHTWEKRIFPIDEVHRDYVVQLNNLDGFSESPKPYKRIEEIKKSFLKISAREPNELKILKNNNIYAIYICSELGGTGVTGFVRDENKTLGGFVILDGEKLQKKANDWISAKESSVFQESKKSRVSIRIADKKNNTPEGAIEYILLHELGHIISQKYGILPDQGDRNRDFSKYEFSKEDWIDEEHSKHDSVFPNRKYIQFYDEDPDYFLGFDGGRIYAELEKTPFPTLYASQNPDDHFAESFVSYVHLFLYKHPWELELKTPKGIKRLPNGLSSNRSRREKEQIARVLNDCKKNP